MKTAKGGMPQFINAIHEAVARKGFKPKKAVCEIPLRVFAALSGFCRAAGSKEVMRFAQV